MGITALHYAAFGMLFTAIGIIANGVLVGAGMTVPSMIAAIISEWGILLPAAWILAFPLGLDANGIWIAWVVSGFCRMLIILGYYGTGNWKRFAL